MSNKVNVARSGVVDLKEHLKVIERAFNHDFVLFSDKEILDLKHRADEVQLLCKHDLAVSFRNLVYAMINMNRNVVLDSEDPEEQADYLEYMRGFNQVGRLAKHLATYGFVKEVK